MKTDELHGAALDWAVDKSLNLNTPYNSWGQLGKVPAYSTDWSQGGPLIESYRITIQFDGDGIRCDLTTDDGGFFVGFDESSPLIAAMRCYVASKMGEEINIPNEVSST